VALDHGRITINLNATLNEFFGLVRKPKYLLGTTYTLSLAFFESVVLPFVDRSRLRSCLIISDAVGYGRALTEGPALREAAQGYMVVPAPSPGCFHAKVWLVVSDDEMAILVGSGNLTQSGFVGNAEVFDAFRFTLEEPPGRALLDDLTAFIAGLGSLWSPEDRDRLLCVEVLAQIREALSPFRAAGGVTDPRPRLLHTLQGRLIDQLPNLASCSDLFVAAPFFGGSVSGLDLLAGRYGDAKLHVFPGVHDGESTDLPLTEVKRQHRPATLAPLRIAPGRNAFAHLKLYGIRATAGESWLFCTSANCTAAAWQGPNVEAGILRSVPAAALASYFVADSRQLPQGQLVHADQRGDAGALQFWAVDTGAGVDLAAPAASRERLPLHGVELIARAGSQAVRCPRETLFADSLTTHLLWTAFPGWTRPRNLSTSLELSATDRYGQPVRGACFVENRMVLTADPMHRSAWRGALALLAADAMPDLADIAAIFGLADSIFAGRALSRSPEGAAGEGQPGEDAALRDPTVHIAIWPPRADESDLHRRIGANGLGRLQWCRAVLETFLRPGNAGASGAEQAAAAAQDDGADDEQDPVLAVKEREESQTQDQKAADRLWDRVMADYDRLQGKLHSWAPTEAEALNIWPGAVIVFLVIAAARRIVRRKHPKMEQEISIGELGEGFLRLVFDERRQPPDFCCPRWFRYRRETFPPLAEDIRKTFGIVVHPDLAIVLLALVAEQKMRLDPQNERPAMGRRYLTQIISDDLHLDAETRQACCRIWRHYLCDDATKLRDDDFCATLDRLWQLATKV